MKKTLIALAAVAATGAAFAQSSVTLYGVADVALTKSTDTSAAVMSAGALNNGTSRWGVRGTEDLGGGLKAGFNFEQGLSLGDGSISTAGAGDFGRAAWMNLSGGFGDLRLGRSLTPSFYGIAAWELTGTANYSVVGSQFGFLNTRSSAQIMYTTPSMAGFSVSFAHVLKGNNVVGAVAATATTPAIAGVERARNNLNAIYRNGPIVVAFAYDKVQDAEAGKSLGGSYDFGGFKLAGSVMDPSGVAKGFTLGGSTTMGPVTLTLDVARDTEAKDTDLLVEAKYALSKRTFTYAAIVRDGKGEDVKNFNHVALGIRHNF
jgi:predicted porin